MVNQMVRTCHKFIFFLSFYNYYNISNNNSFYFERFINWIVNNVFLIKNAHFALSIQHIQYKY